jgi:ketosteroid isomerase-like protein
MTREEGKDVYKANEGFYNAFESRNIKEMEQIWADKDYVQCIHPGWGVLRGRDNVMSSWRRIFENTEEILFMLTEVRIEIQGSLAWVTLYENITTRVGEEVVTGPVLTTNIFEKHNGRWLIIHHHGSTVAQPPNQENPTTFH